MLEVDGILPSPLTLLVLAPTVPEPVCEMQTPALFTMAQTSRQPQSVDTANYAWVNPLVSPTTSSSSSGELHLYIDSDTSPPTVLTGQHRSSQEPPSPLISTTHTAVPSTQPSITTHIPSWAHEVATAEHLYPTQMDVNNTTRKMNRVKMLHTMHNHLFVQHQFLHTNPIIHMNFRLQYASTKLTSPYYINYSYIIQTNYSEGTLRNFDPIKNCFIFPPLYTKTNRPILVPIEYLQCVEGGATNCTYGHTFNLLYTDWMVVKLENRQPSQEDQQIFSHLLALQPQCNTFLRDPDNQAPDFEFEYRL